MDAGRGVSHTEVSRGWLGEGQQGWEGWGGIMRGGISDISDGGMKAAKHLARYVPMQ